MATVSSLVVRRRLASMRQVEDALARQVIYGGDVVTNLLEVAPPPATDESELTRALADALELAAAPLDSMRAPDADAVAKVSRELAEQHGFVPVKIDEGALHVALADPLPSEALVALETSLGMKLVQLAAPLVRLRQALERAYGVSMDRRSRRLASLLDGTGNAPSVPAPRRTSIPDLPDDPLIPTSPIAEIEPAGISATPSRPPPPTTIRRSLPGADALKWFVKNAQTRITTPHAPPPPQTAEAVPAHSPSQPGPRRSDSTARLSITGRRRRGPFTRADAEEVFTEAPTTEDVLGAALQFAQQFFDYVALFLVQDEVAEGFDAHGTGASGSRVRKMGIPLDLPSLYASAREMRTPVIRPRPTEGLDAVIATDLERSAEGDVAVLPMVVGRRVVALLYADDGGEPIDIEEIGEVLAVLATAGAALARIIVRRKQRGVAVVPPIAPMMIPPKRTLGPDVAERAQLLAKALSARKSHPPEPFEKAPSAFPADAPRPMSLDPIVSPIESPGARPVARHTDPYLDAVRSPSSENEKIELEKITQEIDALRVLESEETPSMGLPPDGSDPRRPAVVTPASATPIGYGLPDTRPERSSPAPVSAKGDVAPSMPPPPALSGRRPLAPVIPREEPAERDAGKAVVKAETPTPIDAAEAALVEAIAPSTPIAAPSAGEPTPAPVEIHIVQPAPETPETSEPEAIETTDVTDEELEELLSMAGRESERIEVYAPRPPPRPMAPSQHELPKVIVALEPEHIALVSKGLKGGEAGEKAIKELRALGVMALPAIMDRFPGPTRCDRTTPLASLPKPSDSGPLLALLVALGRLALRDLHARAGDGLPETRFWATYLLTEVIDPESAVPLIPRLVDDDLAVRRVAGLAARALVLADPPAGVMMVEPLVGVVLDPGGGTSLRIRSANALAEIRDERAVEGLILGLEAREEEVVAACHDALTVITRHDPVKTGSTWPTWFSEHQTQSRIEWLIDALMLDDLPMREAAGTELKEQTKQYFGYYANLPRAEREQAYERYRTWWKDEGQAKFKNGAAR